MSATTPKLYIPHVERGDAIIPPMQKTLLGRIREWLFKREDLTVAGREIKNGWVIPQPLGIALIIFILGGVGGLYWRMSDNISLQNKSLSDQKEMIIRLDQRLIDKNDRDQEFRQEIKNDLNMALQNEDAVNKVNEKRLARLEERK